RAASAFKRRPTPPAARRLGSAAAAPRSSSPRVTRSVPGGSSCAERGVSTPAAAPTQRGRHPGWARGGLVPEAEGAPGEARAATAGPRGGRGVGVTTTRAPAVVGQHRDPVDLGGIARLVDHGDQVAILGGIVDGLDAVMSVANSHGTYVRLFGLICPRRSDPHIHKPTL